MKRRGKTRPAGLEPATYGTANRRSIQLSHGRIIFIFILYQETSAGI